MVGSFCLFLFYLNVEIDFSHTIKETCLAQKLVFIFQLYTGNFQLAHLNWLISSFIGIFSSASQKVSVHQSLIKKMKIFLPVFKVIFM